MQTEIQETELYKKFKKALNVQNDMRSDDNPFVVSCCEISKTYAKQALEAYKKDVISKKQFDSVKFLDDILLIDINNYLK